LMRNVLNHPRNFLGLIDQFDRTLQFFVNDGRRCSRLERVCECS
jgi:hypothetical protein